MREQYTSFALFEGDASISLSAASCGARPGVGFREARMGTNSASIIGCRVAISTTKNLLAVIVCIIFFHLP